MAKSNEIGSNKQQIEELQKELQLLLEDDFSATTVFTHYTSSRFNPRLFGTTTKHVKTKYFHARRNAEVTMVLHYQSAH